MRVKGPMDFATNSFEEEEALSNFLICRKSIVVVYTIFKKRKKKQNNTKTLFLYLSFFLSLSLLSFVKRNAL